MTLTAVGASVWASGSHVWKGTTGILTRKAMLSNVKIDPGGDDRVVERADLGQLAHVERAGGEAESEDANDHEGRSEEGVEDVLPRRVEAVAAAPDRDQEVHRDQLDFPEEEEEDEVERAEDAEQAGLEDEEPGEVLLRTQLDAPGDEDRD